MFFFGYIWGRILLDENSSEYFILKSLSGFGSQTCILGSLEVVARFFSMGWDD